MNNRRKNITIRWSLVIYDLLVILFLEAVFLGHYRGGGVLNGKESLEHCALAVICIFWSRFGAGIYRQIWRYGGVQCYIRLMLADLIGTLLYLVGNCLLPIHTISTSRIISPCALNLLSALGLRMMYRYAYKCGRNSDAWGRFLNGLLLVFAGPSIAKQREERARTRVAIVGAGRVGVSLADELDNNANSLYLPVCFVDTNEKKAGRQIHGLPVLQGNKVTTGILNEYDVEEIIFAIPGLTAERKKKLFEIYQGMNYPVKVYDFPIMQSAGGKRQIRSFEVEEVLFRAPVIVKEERSNAYYRGKCILITGGGGSIGSELARQVAAMKPSKLILLDIYENGVYDVQQELKQEYKQDLEIHIEIASIANKRSMERVFRTYHPDIVINAAAHKHVPLMEHNCIEAVENNIFGMLNVIRLCEEYGTGRYMQLSTDKAVNPTNVMGATKRVCEMIMLAYSTRGQVKCSATRFGNVLGSAGSVIPLFKKQIAAGGPITLTDRRIIRYFMTIPEASQLVLQSGAMAENGELFVLDMGNPVKILELAENMIRLSGYVPYKDIDIVETGLRPGEKLYEELLIKSEELRVTDNSLIFIEKDEPITMEELNAKLDILREACETQEDEKVKEALHRIVETFKDPEEVNLEKVLSEKMDELNLRTEIQLTQELQTEVQQINEELQTEVQEVVKDLQEPDDQSSEEPQIANTEKIAEAIG